jgi:hypothetical protein
MNLQPLVGSGESLPRAGHQRNVTLPFWPFCLIAFEQISGLNKS